MKTITESMSQLKGSGSSIFRDVIHEDDFHMVCLLALSGCNILLSLKMYIKRREPINFLLVYIKYLTEQDLPKFYDQI